MAKLDAEQAVANQAAQAFNHRGSTTPAERAAAKGYEGVGTTVNGGPTFAGTPYMYPVDDGQSNIVTIVATGSREEDFTIANKIAGLSEKPGDATWHHVDNYDVRTGTLTLELVDANVHRATVPHAGGCAQYKAATGKEYK